MVEPESRLAGNGERIGPYRIVKTLGRGGMGEVFLARDDRLNRWVAIKRIRPDSNSPILRQRLLQEAFAAGGLRHPALVLVHDLLKEEGDDCLVMEYVSGRTLAEALSDGPLEPALAVRLAQSIASGLSAAHEAGFVHRDLKAENVMVTPANEVKILDFGLAKPIGGSTDSLTATGFVVGTRRSMSPEQARGGEVDERSDLFSFGVLLYEMLTGSSPLQGAHSPATLSAVLGPGLPPPLVALLARLLAREPAARPQSAAEVARELAAIASSLSPPRDPSAEETLRDLPAGAIPRRGGGARSNFSTQPASVPPPEGVHPPRRRHLLRRAILGSLALGVLAAVAIGLRYRAHQKPDLLWVLVLNPPGTGRDAQLRSASEALVRASLRTLGGLRGIIPIGPVVGTAKDVTGTTATEDLLGMTLEPSGNRGIITLSHIRGRDGKVLDDRTFTAPIDAQNVRGLEKAVEAPLRSLFSAHPPRDDVSPAGYAEFFEIQQRIGVGETPPAAELAGLEKLAKQFPDFLGAPLLESWVLAIEPQTQAHHERALRLLQRAKELAPDDPRSLQGELTIYRNDHRLKDAEATLAKMESLAPGNPFNPYFRAVLAEEQGRPAEALNAFRKAAKYVPTWRNLSTLAAAEGKLGLAGDARSHLEQILVDSPNNLAVLRQRAELEMFYGDPARAETMYLAIINRSPTPGDYNDLGNLRFLAHRYADALDSYRAALKIDPESFGVALNIANLECVLGNKSQAGALYRKILQSLEDHPPQAGQSVYYTAFYNISKARCLTALGRCQEALKIAKKCLQQYPDDPRTMYYAAQLFTVTDDLSSALEAVRNALAKHVKPDWFRTPEFTPLAKNPRFQQLLAEAARGQAVGEPASNTHP